MEPTDPGPFDRHRPGGMAGPSRAVAGWRRLRLCGDLTYLDGWVTSTAGGRWPVTDFAVHIEVLADRQVVHLDGPISRTFTVSGRSHPVHRHLALEMARAMQEAITTLRAGDHRADPPPGQAA